MSLYDKLAKIAGELDAIEKKGQNQAQGYAYQRAVDVARPVRAALLKEGILAIISIPASPTTQVLPRPEGKMPQVLTDVDVVIKLVDIKTSETVEITTHGQGADPLDKGIYKAITGAIKYGLRNLFLILDEKADPEIATAEEKEIAAEATGPRKATDSQLRLIRARAQEKNLTRDALKAIVFTATQKHSMKELMAPEVDQILSFINDLAPGEAAPSA